VLSAFVVAVGAVRVTIAGGALRHVGAYPLQPAEQIAGFGCGEGVSDGHDARSMAAIMATLVTVARARHPVVTSPLPKGVGASEQAKVTEQ
jgi:hypothetical protein